MPIPKSMRIRVRDSSDDEERLIISYANNDIGIAELQEGLDRLRARKPIGYADVSRSQEASEDQPL